MPDKGLIIDIGKYSVTVLTQDNAYYKLPRKSTMFVSQEILFEQKDILNASYYTKRLLGAAACFLVVFSIVFYFNIFSKKQNSSQEYAYVSLDINPSMEFAIDSNDSVLNVQNLDSDAKELTKDLHLKGMKVDNAFMEVIKRYEEIEKKTTSGKVSFLIAGAVNPDSKDVQKDINSADNKLSSVLDQIKSDINQKEAKNYDAFVVRLQPEDRKKAREYQISIGRYALYAALNQSGEKISVEEAKSIAVSELVTMYEKRKQVIPDTATAQPTPSGTVMPTTGLLPSPTIPLEGMMLSPTIPPAGLTPFPTTLPTNLLVPSSTFIPSIFFTPSPTVKPPAIVVVPEPLPTATPLKVSQPSPSKHQIQTGTGLLGEYYENIDLTNFELTRVDEVIDFNWGLGAPDLKIRDDGSYSVRWTGQIQPEYSEAYTFYTTRDNGVRLWIDNILVIDKWDSFWGITDTGTILLQGGRKYDIKLEYFNNAGGANIKLEWSSEHTKRSVVPQSCLYAASKPTFEEEVVPGDGTGLKYEYYDNEFLTILKATGVDKTINFNWGLSSPHKTIIPDYTFSARWTGQIQPLYSELYTFYITHDEGVRLWIDDKLVINKWLNTGEMNSKSYPVALKANEKYKIKLEYFNSFHAGSVKMEWSSESTKRSIIPQTRLYP